MFLPRMGVTGFGAIGRIHIAADFDLDHLQGGPELRLEEQIENVALDFGRIVREQFGGRSGAQGAYALKYPSLAIIRDMDLHL